MILTGILDILLVIAICLLGVLLTNILLGSQDGLALLSLAFPLGGGVFSWCIFIVSWMGLPISWISLVILYLSLFCLLMIVNFKVRVFRWPLHVQINKFWYVRLSDRTTLSRMVVAFSLCSLFFLAAIISVGRSYSSWDAMANWGLKGYGIAIEGTVYAADNYGLGLAYPLNLSILIAVFKIFSGDILPGSKIIFPLMFFSWVIASYRFWCQRGISRLIAAFGSLFIATVPIFFEHATIGYADLTFACYIGLGVLWGLEGIFAQNWHYQAISGISLGLVCWTRAEGILYSIILVLTMMIAWRIVGQGRPKLLPWLLPIAIIGLTWLLFAHQDISSGNLGGAVKAALLGISQGEFNLDALTLILIHILKQALVANYWGLLFPLGCTLFIMTQHNFYPKDQPHAFTLMLVLIVAFLLPIGLFYVGSFSSNLSYFQGWVERSFDRAFIPALLLMGNLMILVGMSPSIYRGRIKSVQ